MLNTKFQAVQAGNLGGALIRIEGRSLLPFLFSSYHEAFDFLNDASKADVNLFVGMQPEQMEESVRLWRVTRSSVKAKAVAPDLHHFSPVPIAQGR